jgi:hypothetical protein
MLETVCKVGETVVIEGECHGDAAGSRNKPVDRHRPEESCRTNKNAGPGETGRRFLLAETKLTLESFVSAQETPPPNRQIAQFHPCQFAPASNRLPCQADQPHTSGESGVFYLRFRMKCNWSSFNCLTQAWLAAVCRQAPDQTAADRKPPWESSRRRHANQILLLGIAILTNQFLRHPTIAASAPTNRLNRRPAARLEPVRATSRA